MSAARHLPAVLLAAGAATVAAALAWWGLTFWPPVSNDYLSVTEAGRCLVADSSLCRLATSLCGTRHATLVAAYSPLALWCGAAAAFCGLGSAAPRKARPGSVTSR